MTTTQKMHVLEELLDIEKDTLDENAELSQLSEWDSIAVISAIAMFDSIFGKEVSPEKVKEFKTIKDIINFME